MKYVLLSISMLLLCWQNVWAQADTANIILRGSVIDSSSSKPLPARIVLTDESGHVVQSFYQKLPGFFTNEEGRFDVSLKPGKYRLNVYHGIDYVSHEGVVDVSAASLSPVEIRLQRWYPLKEEGWVNGDGHDHLYTDHKFDSLMLDTVRRVCLAQGIDFMCTAQGWAGYNDSNWRKGYAGFSDDNFFLHYGSEMPKYRTGHTWWLGQITTRGIFEQTMDTTYENHYYQSEQGTTWNFENLKFPQIPDIEVVQRIRKFDSGLAVVAHPTSWWWQKRGSIEKYVTNVAAYLPFGLLAGRIWDAQVVMGYDHDHYYYQNLWFGALNEGYRMTPVSELDGGYNRGDKFYYGSMRTYFHIDGKVTMEKIREAVRKGRTFVTSGPLVFASVDNKYHLGDVINANGEEHTLNIRALASGDRQDYISYVVVFRNGKLYKLWDLRKEKIRTWNKEITLRERSDSWYAIKVYGRKAWTNPELLDVMKYCRKEFANAYDSMGTESDVAITNAFYFRKNAQYEPEPLVAKIDMRIKNSTPAEVDAEVLVNGTVIKKFLIKDGKANFSMPIHGILKLTSGNAPPVYRSLYLDYMPFRAVVEQLASGRWLDNFKSRKYNPGEVPWEAFQFATTKSLLSKVKWEVSLEQNERDRLWEPFAEVFAK